MPYKALTFVEIGGRRFSPGDEISDSDLEEGEDIQALINGGAVSEDMDASVHEAHLTPEEEVVSEAENILKANDEGSGQTNA